MLKTHPATCSLKTLKPHSCLVTIGPLQSGYGHILGFTVQDLVQEFESIKITSVRVKLGAHFAYPSTQASAYIASSLEELLANLRDIYLSEEGEYVLHAKEAGIYDTCTLQAKEIPCSNLESKVLFTKISNRPMTVHFTAKKCRGYCTPPQAYAPASKTFFLTYFSSPFFLREYKVKPYRFSLETQEQLELTLHRKTEVPVESLLAYIADQATSVIKEEIQDLLAEDQLLIEQELAAAVPQAVQEADILGSTLDQIKISARSFNCLKKASIFTVQDLITHTEKDLRQVPNFGVKCLAEIKLKLSELHLALQPETVS